MPDTKQSAARSRAAQPGLLTTAAVLLAYACRPVQTRRWLHFLKTHPILRAAGIAPAEQALKIHRSYLSARLDCAQRTDLLIRHYDIVLRAGFGELTRQAAGRPVTVCRFSGRADGVYELELSALEKRLDGEFILRLSSRGACLQTLAFTLAGDDACTHLRVGSLTGATPAEDVERDLYGCSPAELMMHVAREIGRMFGCGKLILTGDGNRIAPRGRMLLRASPAADRQWRQSGAAMRDDGDFELPCVPPAAGDVLLPPRQRALVDFIRMMVRSRFAAELPCPPQDPSLPDRPRADRRQHHAPPPSAQ